MSKDEMRVPLFEILGIPGFLDGAAKESWLRENRVEVVVDWAGRESVDLPTAWRLKRAYDVMIAKVQAEQREREAEDEAVRQAQRRREELWGKEFQRISNGMNGAEAMARARGAVHEIENDLPRNVRAKLYWPLSPQITLR